MATRAIKPRRDDTMLTGFQSMRERAPSLLREDQPTAQRMLAGVGLLFSAVGVLAFLAVRFQFPYLVNPTFGGLFLSLGLGLMLFHAFGERDPQFRRLYTSFGLTLAFLAVGLRLFAFGKLGGYFLPLGVPGLFVALLVFVGVLRNETEAFWKGFLLGLIGVLGALMVGAGMIVGQFSEGFLLGEGCLEIVLGLMYVGTFAAFQESEENTFRTCLAVGLVGLGTFAVALVRSWGSADFLIPSGFTLMAFGLVYVAIALGSVSDWPLVVMVRRELTSYFFSPIAYLVFFGFLLIAWFNFLALVEMLIPPPNIDPRRPFSGPLEPIVGRQIINLVTVIGQMFVVPVLTMRLLSEEKRSGTLEVLLTAPVNETTVVLGKFFGSLIFYMLTWAPCWLFLVALRVIGGEEFDYRPVLSFQIALLACGSGFVAMGLFFSSLTGNQIIAAVLTFVGMVAHFGTYIIKAEMAPEMVWSEILTYCSFIDLWFTSLQGQVSPRYLGFHISATIFFLFLTIKVLESRKWK